MMMELVAITPIRHDGDSYQPRQVFDLPESDALALIKIGAAVPAPEAEKPKRKPKD